MNHKKAMTQDERREAVKKVQEHVAAGENYKDAFRMVGISSSQYYPWSKQMSATVNGDARKIKPRNVNTEKQLLIENQRLKMIVADQALDIQALKEYNAR